MLNVALRECDSAEHEATFGERAPGWGVRAGRVASRRVASRRDWPGHTPGLFFTGYRIRGMGLYCAVQFSWLRIIAADHTHCGSNADPARCEHLGTWTHMWHPVPEDVVMCTVGGVRGTPGGRGSALVLRHRWKGGGMGEEGGTSG